MDSFQKGTHKTPLFELFPSDPVAPFLQLKHTLVFNMCIATAMSFKNIKNHIFIEKKGNKNES
jgi:hypothetical protein